MYPEILNIFDTIWHQILFHLRVDRISSHSKKLENIAPLDLHILFLVHETPTILMGELCKRLKIPNTTLSSAITRMEKKGLLQRVISSQDLRSFGLQMTSKGQEIWKEFDDIHSMFAHRLLNCLDEQNEKERLYSLFQKAALTLDPECNLEINTNQFEFDQFKEAWQKTLYGIRIDHLESWTEALKNLSQLDLHILNLIHGNPGMMLKGIHQTLDIPSSTVTVIVKKLEKKNYLVRQSAPDDLRAWNLKITSAGLNIIDEQTNLNNRLWNLILGSLDNQAQQEMFLQLLTKILNRIM